MINSKIEMFMHNTYFTEVLDENYNLCSTATSFLYAYNLEKDCTEFNIAMVTNKHVVENAKFIRYSFNINDENKKPIPGEVFKVTLDETKIKNFIFHPNGLDLAALDVTDIIVKHKEETSLSLNITPLSPLLIPSPSEWNNLNSIEEVIMIGYPKGIWDEVNNLPVFRKGITATHPTYNFKGNPEFLIDAACLPGSSGSPVFLNNTGFYWDKVSGSYKLESRFHFLGIQYQIPIHLVTTTSSHYDTPIQLKNGETVIAKVPTNLGYIIKSTELAFIKEFFNKA
ncbi:MAG: S1 family peptidase [Clostridium sp.]